MKVISNTILFVYRVFSFTWPASMQIYWNKRKRLHKKRVQLPQDWFGTPTWPPFHCFGTPIWPPWRHLKTLYSLRGALIKIARVYHTQWCNYFDGTTPLLPPTTSNCYPSYHLLKKALKRESANDSLREVFIQWMYKHTHTHTHTAS